MRNVLSSWVSFWGSQVIAKGNKYWRWDQDLVIVKNTFPVFFSFGELNILCSLVCLGGKKKCWKWIWTTQICTNSSFMCLLFYTVSSRSRLFITIVIGSADWLPVDVQHIQGVFKTCSWFAARLQQFAD